MHYDLVSSPGASSPPQTTGVRPAERRLTGGGASYYHNQSQSCRFVVPRSLADELHLLRDDEGRDPAEGLPPAADGRGLSRSRRFSSMRVFGRVSGVPETVIL